MIHAWLTKWRAIKKFDSGNRFTFGVNGKIIIVF